VAASSLAGGFPDWTYRGLLAVSMLRLDVFLGRWLYSEITAQHTQIPPCFFLSIYSNINLLGCREVREARGSVPAAPSRVQGVPRTAERPWIRQGSLFRHAGFVQLDGDGLARSVSGGSVQQMRTTILPQDGSDGRRSDAGARRIDAFEALDPSRY